MSRKNRNSLKVGFSVASYLNDDARRVDSLRCLIASLQSQTHRNWEAVIVHDGPVSAEVRPAWLKLQELDSRVRLEEAQHRAGDHGHHWRRPYALTLDADYIAFSNDDNYYAPVFLEQLLEEAVKGAEMVYCDMVHSHRKWRAIAAKPLRGYMDMGNWICRRERIQATEWTDFSFAADWHYFRKIYVEVGATRVPAVLFVHN